MTAKKRRRRARAKKSGSVSVKKRTRRKRGAVASAPRSHKRRVRRANPSSRRHRFHASTRRHKRRHRRNPGLPLWAEVGLSATLGVLGFAAASAASYAYTQRTDATFATIGRNNMIAAAVVLAGGVFLAIKKKPLLGVGLAAGGLAAGAGAKASALVTKLLPQPVATTTVSAVYGENGMASVHQLEGYEPIGGYEPISSVYGQDGMAAVYADY